MNKTSFKAKGNQGNWFAKVGAEDIPCLLKMWLRMPNYHDPHATLGEPKWEKYVCALRTLKRAVLTDNAADGTYSRKGYIAVYEIEDIVFDQEGLRCTFISRLHELK